MLPNIITVGLVTFLLVYFLKELEGPFGIFAAIQNAVIVTDEEGNPTTFFGKLYSCWWCLSTWVAAVVTVLMVFVTGYVPFDFASFVYWIFVWLGAIAIANLVNSFIVR